MGFILRKSMGEGLQAEKRVKTQVLRKAWAWNIWEIGKRSAQQTTESRGMTTQNQVKAVGKGQPMEGFEGSRKTFGFTISIMGR